MQARLFIFYFDTNGKFDICVKQENCTVMYCGGVGSVQGKPPVKAVFPEMFVHCLLLIHQPLPLQQQKPQFILSFLFLSDEGGRDRGIKHSVQRKFSVARFQ